MDFTYPPHVIELTRRTREFIEREVYPLESQINKDGLPPAGLAAVRQKAREAGIYLLASTRSHSRPIWISWPARPRGRARPMWP